MGSCPQDDGTVVGSGPHDDKTVRQRWIVVPTMMELSGRGEL